MSEVVPIRPENDAEQLTFTVEMPRERVRYALNAKEQFTDLDLRPGLLVKGTFAGVVDAVTLRNLSNGDRTSGKWVILVDECDLELL